MRDFLLATIFEKNHNNEQPKAKNQITDRHTEPTRQSNTTADER